MADKEAPAAADAAGKRKADALDGDAGSESPTAELERAIKRHRAAADAITTRPSDTPANSKAEGHMHTELVVSAGRFFDEHLAGWLEAKDLEGILHLTQPLACRRYVQGAVEAVVRRGRLRCASAPLKQLAFAMPLCGGRNLWRLEYAGILSTVA